MDRGFGVEEALNGISSLRELVRAAGRDRWKVIYAEAQKILSSDTVSIEEKAFALQWAVIGCEVEFDLKTRQAWISRWNDLPVGDSPYCQYLEAYQHALTSFFQGALRESEARFRRAFDIASEMAYDRGQQRTLFHLGLIQRDLFQPGAALEYLTRALLIAQERRDRSYIKRIKAQMDRVAGRVESGSNEFSFARVKSEVESLIAAKKVHRARTLLVEAELRRRKFKQGRKREALFVYLPLLLLLNKRISPEAAWKRLRAIQDPILKIRLMGLMGRVSSLEASWKSVLDSLKRLHGVADVVKQEALDQEVEICGTKLGDIADGEIKGLMELLVASQHPLGKEELCKALWGLNYDPVVHDGRIYKLIHKTRKFFKRPDLLVNTYGAYQIDPRYQIKEPRIKAKAS
jgi:hypothetical protein